jgi:hypothetical protein
MQPWALASGKMADFNDVSRSDRVNVAVGFSPRNDDGNEKRHGVTPENANGG